MARTITIANVSYFTGAGFTNGTITVTDSNISNLTPSTTDTPSQSSHNVNTTTVDGSSRYLVPGLIDSHIHLGSHAPSILTTMAKQGITTALDMGCWPPSNWQPYSSSHSRYTAASPLLAQTDIRSSAAGATVPGTLHSKFPGLDAYSLTSDDQAQSWVDARVNEGASYIKIIADTPIGPSQKLMNDIVLAAHKHDKPVVVHAARLEAFRMAVQCNADIITHLPLDGELDDETVAAFATSSTLYPAQRKACCPTLSILKVFAQMGNPAFDYKHCIANLRKLHAAGIPILAGTDANKSGGPFDVEHGTSLHSEMELMLESGMTTSEVLNSATRTPAEWFGPIGLGDRGIIEVGKRADLVLLSGNPLVDIASTRRIEKVWIGGLEVEIDG